MGMDGAADVFQQRAYPDRLRAGRRQFRYAPSRSNDRLHILAKFRLYGGASTVEVGLAGGSTVANAANSIQLFKSRLKDIDVPATPGVLHGISLFPVE